MLLGHRLLLLGVLSLPILNGCGSTSMGSESGTIAPTGTVGTMPTAPVTPPKAAPVGGGVSGTDNTVSATASVGAVSVEVGASQTISITFTSLDGLSLSGFSVYGSLGVLPADWSAPSSLTCATVGPGSGCVLTLTYAPTAIESGTLTLDCVYVDNAGLPRTPGPCLTLSYASTAANNVMASLSPSGEVDAAIGGSKQSVSVTFTTDDGNAATALSVTNLGSSARGMEQYGAGLVLCRREHRQRLRVAAYVRAHGAEQRHPHAELHLHRRIRRHAQRGAQHSLRHDRQRHGDGGRLSERPGECDEHGRRAVGGRHLHHGEWEHRRRFECVERPDQAAARLEQFREHVWLRQRQHRQRLPTPAQIRADRAYRRHFNVALRI